MCKTKIAILTAVLLGLTTTSGIAFSSFQQTQSLKLPNFIIPVLDEWEARYCLAKYNRDVEKSKELISKNGSMTEFFYSQRRLRQKYFELDADRMVYDQMFIDVWESFDIGEINEKTAFNYTMQIMNKGYDNSNERMKSCR